MDELEDLKERKAKIVLPLQSYIDLISHQDYIALTVEEYQLLHDQAADQFSRSDEILNKIHTRTVPKPKITDLKKIMKDPRYWRDRDPELIEQVRTGFKELYPND